MHRDGPAYDMKVKLVQKDSNLIEVAVSDADLSLLQILQHELLSMDNVEFAAYKRPHPLEKTYFLVVRTRNGNPSKTLIEAVEKAKERVHQLLKELEKI